MLLFGLFAIQLDESTDVSLRARLTGWIHRCLIACTVDWMNPQMSHCVRGWLDESTDVSLRARLTGWIHRCLIACAVDGICKICFRWCFSGRVSFLQLYRNRYKSGRRFWKLLVLFLNLRTWNRRTSPVVAQREPPPPPPQCRAVIQVYKLLWGSWLKQAKVLIIYSFKSIHSKA